MIPVGLAKLAQILNATHHGADLEVIDVVHDTGKITPGCLFIALCGERFDGHDFAEQAIRHGATALLVSRHLPFTIPQLQVADTRQALGDIAAWVRNQVSVRLVALTGSAGKTSVKEMTAAILQQCGKVLYTAGNLNNDIGVPMTLLRLTPEHQYAVIELGANHLGEIAYTANLARPEAALINNISAAHLEGFGSLKGVAQAKGEIFKALPLKGRAIINADSCDEVEWQESLERTEVWRCSALRDQGVDFYATEVVMLPQGCAFILHTPIGNTKVTLRLLGRHHIANVLAASALALAVDAPLSAITDGLAQLTPIPGRTYPIVLNKDQLLIDDTYNANLGSMLAAIDTLSALSGYRVLVVGDMGELGEAAIECHRQVGAATRGVVDEVLSLGHLSQVISQANSNGQHFTKHSALVSRLIALCQQYPAISILVKGSRSSAMERVVQSLQEAMRC